MIKLFWVFLSFLIAGFIGYYAFNNPDMVAPLINLISLAVAALAIISMFIPILLLNRCNISPLNYQNIDEKNRILKALDDDKNLVSGQIFILRICCTTLLLSIILRWLILNVDTSFSIYIKPISAIFMFMASLSIIFLLETPKIIKSICDQRRSFE